MVRKYKKREKDKWITIYDELTHPEWFTSDESFSLLYSEEDWLWFSEVFVNSKWFAKIFSENNIDAKEYVSKIIFNINRENFDKNECIYVWYKRIKEFIDFLWTDYIAVWDNLQSVIDLETWELIKYLT